MLVAQLILGVGVNLHVRVPAADRGHGLGTALGRALTRPPAALAAHAALGTLPLVAAVNVLARTIRARHKLAMAASATRLAAIAGAAASGASFVSDGRTGAFTAMAVLTGAAFLCYLGNLFAVPPGPTEASQGGRDD